MGWVLGLGNGVVFRQGGGSGLGSSYWTSLISATVENAAPTKIVMTFGTVNTSLIATDFTIAGKSITLLERDLTNKILTLTLSEPIEYGNNLTVTLNKGAGFTTKVTNNIAYLTALNNAFGAASIISHFPTNETTGTTLTDTKNGYNATLVSPLLDQVGPSGLKAIHLAVNCYGNVYNPSTHLDIDEGTILLWVKTTSAIWKNNTTRNLFKLSYAVGGLNFNLYVDGSNNTLYFYTQRGGVTKYVTEVIDSDGWVLLAVSWSVTNNRIRGYTNGNPFMMISETAGFAHDGTAFWDSQCGLNSAYGSVYSNGLIGSYSNIVLLNKECTEAELKKLYNFDQIIFDGDSRSYQKRWDAVSINSNIIGRRNAATAGAKSDNSATGVITYALTKVDPFIKADSVNTVVLWIGVNDASQTAQFIYDNIKTYCAARRAAGINKIVLCTEIDAQGAVDASWHTSKYQALNALIAADHSFVDAVADLGANVNLQDATNATYFNADRVHLTNAGYDVVGGIVRAALQEAGSIT